MEWVQESWSCLLPATTGSRAGPTPHLDTVGELTLVVLAQEQPSGPTQLPPSPRARALSWLSPHQPHLRTAAACEKAGPAELQDLHDLG